MENDVNSTQVVTEQDVKDQVVTDQSVTEQVADAQKQDEILADGTSKDKTVPYSRLEEEAKARKAAEEQAMTAQRQLELMQMSQQTQQQAEQPKTTLDQAMLNMGITADEMYGDVQVKVFNEKARLDAILQQAQTAQVANQQFVNSHTDFTQVVGSVNPATGQIMAWSQEALSLQQRKSHLAGAFQTAHGAYTAIMDERRFAELEKNANANQEHLKRQGVDIISLPLGGSAAGGSTGGDIQSEELLPRSQVAEIERKLAAGDSL